jgi:hypothetical protein
VLVFDEFELAVLLAVWFAEPEPNPSARFVADCPAIPVAGAD